MKWVSELQAIITAGKFPQSLIVLGQKLYLYASQDAWRGMNLILLICFFPCEPHLPSQIYRQMYGKLFEKLTEHLLVRLLPSNLVNTIFHLVF